MGKQNMSSVTRTYGWRRDLPDKRDLRYAPSGDAVKSSSVDLRSKCPAVYNQGHLGSCTANALAACFQFAELDQNVAEPWMPSRLFIYYNERAMEGTVSNDSGAVIRDGVKSLNSVGVCPESEWPYDEAKFALRPPAACYDAARRDRVLRYRKVKQDLYDLKHCLETERKPIAFGFSVFESFESDAVAKTGRMPMPDVTSESLLGGHAVCAVGFSDAHEAFIVRNSWGAEWGESGYFYMPYKFIIDPDFASDFWVTLDDSATHRQQPALTLSSPS